MTENFIELHGRNVKDDKEAMVGVAFANWMKP
jgi:hypothetical protein